MSMSFPAKDPAATLDYQVDWSAWLADGETLTPEITVSDGITLNPNGKTTTVENGRKATFWLAGGTAGEVYSIGFRITTSAGRVDERTIKLPVLER